MCLDQGLEEWEAVALDNLQICKILYADGVCLLAVTCCFAAPRYDAALSDFQYLLTQGKLGSSG